MLQMVVSGVKDHVIKIVNSVRDQPGLVNGISMAVNVTRDTIESLLTPNFLAIFLAIMTIVTSPVRKGSAMPHLAS